MRFFPVNKDDLRQRGWHELDVILITGDAYVDHPSFGAAVIGRVLERHGFRVGIIAQPDWRKRESFLIMGKPKLFFGITSGNVDSMVANYTANKRPRKKDEYSPGGLTGLRPDRALIVYANRVREAFKDVPIVLGGLEASMRRLAHYDYWDNAVRRSILVDARGDMLVYGMGETQVLEIARKLSNGGRIESLNNIRGTVVIRKDASFLQGSVTIPSYEEVKESTDKFSEAFRAIYVQQNPFSAKPIIQPHGDRCVIHFPPPLPLSTQELDTIYELPYLREWHPACAVQGGVKALETVRFSLIAHRGCCGECSFCSLCLHQGKIVQSRSPASLVREAEALSRRHDFKGTITDIGGPTANLYGASCSRWQKKGFCADKSCLAEEKCENLKLNYQKSIALYRCIRQLPKVKHAFIGSGFRYDLLTDEAADHYLEEVCRFHISGQMKVAPEHTVDYVLKLMNKAPRKAYENFVRKFTALNQRLPRKCFLVNYFISSHPGSGMHEARSLAQYCTKRNMHPEQIQDYIPLPMTLSGCMYHTGVHPFTGEQVYVPRAFTERKMQRALVQHQNPDNRKLLEQAVRKVRARPGARKMFVRAGVKPIRSFKK